MMAWKKEQDPDKKARDAARLLGRCLQIEATKIKDDASFKKGYLNFRPETYKFRCDKLWVRPGKEELFKTLWEHIRNLPEFASKDANITPFVLPTNLPDPSFDYILGMKLPSDRAAFKDIEKLFSLIKDPVESQDDPYAHHHVPL